LNATTSFKTANLPVRVIGVGFFDFQHGQTGVAPNAIELHPLLDISFNTTATCTSSVGPGIAPPASVPAGVDGFHAAWYGQSGYQRLCPGDRSSAVVAYYNTGSRGWVSGRLGEVAYLGTWNPVPGQDQPSQIGGDGGSGSPNTGWPRYNRVAIQPASYVGPDQIAWFQFTLQAPVVPGTYTLAIRPLIEGAQWMEDYGVFWYVTVLTSDGALPPTPTPSPPPTATPVPTPTPMPSGTGACHTDAPANPWGYDFCTGTLIFQPAGSFCSYYSCIASFWNGLGYVIQCGDLLFSLSGGRSGACSSHGGTLRPLYAH
jgi:hypothetical protein